MTNVILDSKQLIYREIEKLSEAINIHLDGEVYSMLTVMNVGFMMVDMVLTHDSALQNKYASLDIIKSIRARLDEIEKLHTKSKDL
jgi:hypothetical protein